MADVVAGGEPKYLAWMDLETTGLDARWDHILEVALVVTRWEPSLEEVSSLSLVVKPAVKDWADRMLPDVKKMHEKSRLLREVPYGVTLPEAAWAVVDVLRNHGGHGDFMLAGSGVHFDRRFMAEKMSQVERYFTYPHFDTGVVRRFVALSGAQIERDAGRVKHRAMSDVQHHLAEARDYLTWMAS